MNTFKEGQDIRIRHSYTVGDIMVTPYGVSYILSFEGVQVSGGTPSLALPENIQGLYEVVLSGDDIENLDLVNGNIYQLTFLGYNDIELTQLLTGSYDFSITRVDNYVLDTSLTSLVSKVRSRLTASCNNLYTDAEIEIFLIECLAKHDENYADFSEVPDREIPLIILLVEIECLDKYQTSQYDTNGGNVVSIKGLAGSIQVDGSKWGQNFGSYYSGLQGQYDNQCRRLGVGQWKIAQNFIPRMDKETRKTINRQLATNPEGRVRLIGSSSSGNVTLTWNRLMYKDFLKYEIYRNNVVIFSGYNGLKETYLDKDLVSGSYSYYILYWNTLQLTRKSNVVVVNV